MLNIKHEKGRNKTLKYCQGYSNSLLNKAFLCHASKILLFLLFLLPKFIFCLVACTQLILGDTTITVFIYGLYIHRYMVYVYFIGIPELYLESREILA